MILRRSFPGVSFALSSASALVAAGSILLARRLDFTRHMPLFNMLAMVMLALVVAGLVVGIVGLARNRGKGLPLWAAETLALVILGSYLLDG